MSRFKDPEAAERARERLEELCREQGGLDLKPFFESAFTGNADPDLALTNLERWLRVTSSPHLHLEQITGIPRLGRLLVTLFGASQPIADSLIQNPELASLVLEPGQLRKIPDRESLLAEGRRLLANSTSFTHALDRLRYLRQRWVLPLVINDLAGTWDPETVWRVISDLADALIELTVQTVWDDLRAGKDLPVECPVMVVAFGKLAGHELNYSSDVDLVYVVPDGLPESTERICAKFGEALARSLSNRMGRGSLYRVDLRLRPYGGAGAIVRSMRSTEAYYQLYAEPWEVQALLRSRPLVGPADLCDRWEEMRARTCFRPKLSEVALEEMLAMRARIEEGADLDDLKRGPGGIRDAEFLTQILQLVNGLAFPSVRVRPTCDALRALNEEGKLDPAVATALIEGYKFLRQLEHRTQLVGDQQTHHLPTSDEARDALGRLMGLSDGQELLSSLDGHRQTIQTLYRSTLNLEHGAKGVREDVASLLGPALGTVALQWFDVLPESEAFYLGLKQNQDSLQRVERVLSHAPRLVQYFKSSVALTEQLMSGEIEEPTDTSNRLRRLSIDAPLPNVATAAGHAITVELARWTLGEEEDLGERLSAIGDALLIHVMDRKGADFDVIATGSFGTREFGPGSDADLVLLIEDREKHRVAEGHAQQFLAAMGQLKRLGVPFEVDLRLRPEGGKGLLVRTYEGFQSYDREGMETWERFALGHSRLVRGKQRAIELVRSSAYRSPLDAGAVGELMKMKRRVETERVLPQHARRNVKLGTGGLNDIEWLIHMIEMRYPVETEAGTTSDFSERIRKVARAGYLNALESEFLLDARAFLLSLRTRIYLLGLDDDLLPENPDRLDRLAASAGFERGNSLLGRYQDITEGVRRLFLEGTERLKK